MDGEETRRLKSVYNPFTLRRENGSLIISAEVKNPEALIEPGNTLNPDAAEYLMLTLDEAHASAEDDIRVELFCANPALIEKAVSEYFSRTAALEALQFRAACRRGLHDLRTALLVLIICGTPAIALTFFNDQHPLLYTLGQCLVIVGWVAFWKPAEFYLYSRGRQKKHMNLVRRLAAAEVTVKEI
ncbi:MAG: hypothetical protein Q4Q04_02715 [Methanocorpusculum sp.]|nr:hypothetical protein [Methanocorpusculum sp.]